MIEVLPQQLAGSHDALGGRQGSPSDLAQAVSIIRPTEASVPSNGMEAKTLAATFSPIALELGEPVYQRRRDFDTRVAELNSDPIKAEQGAAEFSRVSFERVSVAHNGHRNNDATREPTVALSNGWEPSPNGHSVNGQGKTTEEISQNPLSPYNTSEMDKKGWTLDLPNIEIGKKPVLKFVARELAMAIPLVSSLPPFKREKEKAETAVEEASHFTDEERILEVRKLVSTLQVLQGSAEGYAWNRTKRALAEMTYVSPFEKEFSQKAELERRKTEAMVAVFQLMEIEKMPAEKRDAVMQVYRTFWGEEAKNYKDIYQSAKRAMNAQSQTVDEESNTSVRKDAANILADFNIPIDQKVNMLIAAGFAPGDAGRAVRNSALAAILTLGITAAAEGGAVISAGGGAVQPFLPGLEMPINFSAIGENIQQIASHFPDIKQTWGNLKNPVDMEKLLRSLEALGVDAEFFGVFYGVTALYAKAHALMTEATGYGMNVWATGIYYVDKALGVARDEIQKDMIKMLLIVNLMIDAPYLVTILIPHIGPSMMANAYQYGIIFTATQLAICLGVLGGAKLLGNVSEKVNASQQKQQEHIGTNLYNQIEKLHPHKIDRSYAQVPVYAGLLMN